MFYSNNNKWKNKTKNDLTQNGNKNIYVHKINVENIYCILLIEMIVILFKKIYKFNVIPLKILTWLHYVLLVIFFQRYFSNFYCGKYIYTIKFAVLNFKKIFSLKITFKIFIKVEGA